MSNNTDWSAFWDAQKHEPTLWEVDRIIRVLRASGTASICINHLGQMLPILAELASQRAIKEMMEKGVRGDEQPDLRDDLAEAIHARLWRDAGADVDTRELADAVIETLRSKGIVD